MADLRLPAATGRPAPLVVVVHGGFWRDEWDRAHAGPQSDGLAAAGYVVATVEYRRVGGAGGWPATLDDVALLGDTLPGLVADAVGDRVDPARTVLVGHSAGGHLAAWSAARHRLPADSPWHRATALPVGVVALAGVLDLGLSERLGLGGHAARALLGGSPDEQPDRYAAADPARLLPTGVPTVLVHGTLDEDVPVDVSRSVPRRGRCRRRRRRPARAPRRRPHVPGRPHLPRLAHGPQPPSPTPSPDPPGDHAQWGTAICA